MTLRGLIQPQHEIVQLLWSRAPKVDGPVTPLGQLRAAIAATRAWAASRTLGARPYDEIEATARASCLSWACVVCAALRWRGARETYVALGSPVGRVPVVTHAWLLVRDADGRWYVSDVTARVVQAIELDAFFSENDVLAIFNDESIWMGAEPRTRFRLLSLDGKERQRVQ